MEEAAGLRAGSLNGHRGHRDAQWRGRLGKALDIQVDFSEVKATILG
jgi:hypothetical protein